MEKVVEVKLPYDRVLVTAQHIVFSIGGDLDRGLGGRSWRVSAENFFLPSPQNVTFGGGTAGDSLCS